MYYDLVVASGHTPASSEQLTNAITTAASYLVKVAENPYCNGNWLHIQGSIGTGKTTLSKAIVAVYRKLILYPRAPKMKTADDLARFLRQDSTVALFDEIRNHRDLVILDDLGTEPTEVQTFGNVVTPSADVFLSRYNNGFPMVYTTNLNGEEIGRKYGERILDRMKERAVVITLSGKSHRGNAETAV